jgi:hypothetical protein
MSRLVRLVDKNYELNEITGTTTSDPIDLDGAEQYSVQSVVDVNTPSAKTFDSDRYEVATLTFETKADTDHQDFVIVSSQSGLTFAVALTKPVASVDTVNFADKASTTAGDYFVVYDADGLAWAAAMNVSGADPAPTGAIYTAIPAGRKVNVDISSATNDEDVAALVETALNALTGFSTAFTTDDTAADGNMLITRDTKGPTTAPVVKNADDSGAGSITATNSTAGVASVAPSGALWTAVNASRKGLADISGDTTAAQVAARVETALNALTGFTALITTDDTAANGTMTLTQTAYGPTTNPVPKNASESGAGGITVAETTPGLTSEVTEGAGNSVTIPTHGFFDGLKGQLTTTGTLPAGVTTATDYFIIVVDANTVQFAASLADALAGTAIDITDEGSGVHTFTPTSLAGGAVKIQKSNSPAKEVLAGDGTWDDVAAATSITADANVWFEKDRPTYRWIRVHYTLTAGSMSTDNYVLVKGTP